MTNDSEKYLAGFWRRLAALLIDLLIIYFTGFLLGLLLGDYFAQWGEWARLVGLVICLSYLGVCNSKLTNGQTIGKKGMGIRVVDSQGKPLTLPLAMIRQFILVTPFILNGINPPFDTTSTLMFFLMGLIAVIVLGGMFAIVYLYVFNRATRQSLHDLAVGSYVVNINGNQEAFNKTWRPHLFVISIVALIAIVFVPSSYKLRVAGPTNELSSLGNQLKNHPEIDHASVQAGSSYFKKVGEEATTTKYVKATIHLVDSNVENNDLAIELARWIFQNYPNSRTKDAIHIQFVHGYDIGIWSKWHKKNFSFDPKR